MRKDGEEVLAVKDTHTTMHEHMKGVFTQATRHGWDDHGHDMQAEADKGHARFSRRTTTITWDAPFLATTASWPQRGCLW